MPRNKDFDEEILAIRKYMNQEGLSEEKAIEKVVENFMFTPRNLATALMVTPRNLAAEFKIRNTGEGPNTHAKVARVVREFLE